jgi:hypothetical protein
MQEYVGEQRVLSSVNYVKFACDLFDLINDFDVGYCFKYVTLSTDGAVSEQASQCVSASQAGTRSVFTITLQYFCKCMVVAWPI